MIMVDGVDGKRKGGIGDLRNALVDDLSVS